MTYTAVNPHACCNRPRPEDAHAAARPPPHPHALPHLTNSDGLRWKTWPAASKRPPHSNAAAKTPQPIHTSPGPTQTPHTPAQPTADATTQPKPRSSSHYGTEFFPLEEEPSRYKYLRVAGAKTRLEGHEELKRAPSSPSDSEAPAERLP
jgi:hypothetical protein